MSLRAPRSVLIHPKESGLPMLVTVLPNRIRYASPRLTVSMRYGDDITPDWFAMTIDDTPRLLGYPGYIVVNDLKKVSDYIIANKDNLLDLYGRTDQ